MLKFFFNGIKGADGKLQKCFYSDGQLINYPAGTLTIYGRDYVGFSAEVRAAFEVKNDSDYQTDYIVQDHIRVKPDHPLYQQVLAGLKAQEAHRAAVKAKRDAKRAKVFTAPVLPPVGARVGFVDGPGVFPKDRAGTVVGIAGSRFGQYAIVLMDGTGAIEQVHGMTDVGIGCYLLNEVNA